MLHCKRGKERRSGGRKGGERRASRHHPHSRRDRVERARCQRLNLPDDALRNRQSAAQIRPRSGAVDASMTASGRPQVATLSRQLCAKRFNVRNQAFALLYSFF
jgi:hypothetical protein